MCSNSYLGNVSQWGEVKKKTKERAHTKGKESSADGAEVPSRGGRSRAADGYRGGRGRVSERGRGGGRGRAKDSTASRKSAVSETIKDTAASTVNDTWETPVETSATVEGWDQAAQAATTPEDSTWEVVTPPEAVPPPAAEQPQQSSRPDGTRTWASMLKPAAKPKPAVPTPKAVAAPQPTVESTIPVHPSELQPLLQEAEIKPVSVELSLVQEPTASASPGLPPSEPALELTPSKDQLTESNLEQVEDVSDPPPTMTVASTAGTNDPRSATASVIPAAGQHQTTLRPGLGGYQTTALKATSGSGRSSSFVRRLKEQQEAVVMPGNHAVDRTAVQFGSLGLGGSTEDLDVDDDREEPETRTQPPQHSPVAPKASLPPAPQQAPEPLKAAPGLGTSPQPGPNPQPEQIVSQPISHSYGYNQFGNLYGTGTSQSTENSFPAQKSYEPFGQPASHTSAQPGSGYPQQSQAPGQPGQTTQQSHLGGFTTAGSDYPSYYTSDMARNAYPSAHGTYGQPPHTAQEGSGTQQKPSGPFVTSAAELPAQVAPSQPGHPAQARFGPTETHNSGHSTPNPVPGQQGQGPGHQGHQMSQAHGQGYQQHAGYPYGANAYYGNYYHPGFMSQHAYGPERGPYDDIRRYETDHYMSQNQHYGHGGNQGRYGAGPYAGGSKYGQPHQNYGMSPQSWDAHSSSPANAGGYGQQSHSVTGRENSASVGSYGRTGSTQPSENQQHGASSFGAMPDPFGSRSQPSYGSQAPQQTGSQQGGNEDASRAFGESSKIAGGPSPAPGQTTGRPTSAANMQNQTSQNQSQQSYAGYPQLGSQMHGQQSQYSSGLGGLSHQHPGQQSHQSGYGGYGAFGNNYYGNNSRGW